MKLIYWLKEDGVLYATPSALDAAKMLGIAKGTMASLFSRGENVIERDGVTCFRTSGTVDVMNPTKATEKKLKTDKFLFY